jgi:hypothetical protein
VRSSSILTSLEPSKFVDWLRLFVVVDEDKLGSLWEI